jgi:hypothetical protein
MGSARRLIFEEALLSGPKAWVLGRSSRRVRLTTPPVLAKEAVNMPSSRSGSL